jgi:hypothetical protein
MIQQIKTKFAEWLVRVMNAQFDALVSRIAVMEGQLVDLNRLDSRMTELENTLVDIEGGLDNHRDQLVSLTTKLEPPVLASPIDPLDAIKLAYEDVGLPMDEFSPEFDLARTGKLNDVLTRAAKHVGCKHPVRTIADLHKLLGGS